jgi:hypothetical protein
MSLRRKSKPYPLGPPTIRDRAKKLFYDFPFGRVPWERIEYQMLNVRDDAIAAERERCARIAARMRYDTGLTIASAIRAAPEDL